MHTITIPLYQHTPLIHFQGDQPGATLRATEVKPRLDRFIINRMGWKAVGVKDPAKDRVKLKGFTEQQLYDKGWEYIKQHHPLWISNSDEANQKSLNYRVQIFSRQQDQVSGVHGKAANTFGNYFADVGNEKKADETVRLVTHHRVIMLKILVPDDELEKRLKPDTEESLLTPFFYATNFGTRQSKGFGSFSPAVAPPDEAVFKFYLNTTKLSVLFGYLELFNRVVRTGVNQFRDPEGGFNKTLYMKPLVFSYAATKDIVWEKKLVKEAAGYGVYNGQKNYTDTPSHTEPATGRWPAWYDGGGKNKKDRKQATVRNVMGLSTNQTWKYGREIRNREGKFIGYEDKSLTKTSTRANTPQSIERAPSPFTLVPIKMGEGYAVYVYVQDLSKVYLDHTFTVKFGGKDVGQTDGQAGQLKVFPGFSMREFIDDYFKESVIEASAVTKNDRDEEIKQTLLNIFRQIEDKPQLQNILPA